MTIKRNGSAVWSGGIKDGKGAVSTGSGALKDAHTASIPASKTAPAPIRKN